MNFEPGELIVKLKDQVDAGVTYTENGKAVSNFNIGELLGIEDKIESSDVMFHKKGIEASIVNSQKMKAVYAAKAAANPNNGYQPKEPLTMKNIFVLKTTNQQENILMLIDQIKNNPNVEYAEPNYIYSIDDFEVGEIITAEEANSMISDVTIDVDDPLYSSQTNITTTNIDDVWDQYTTGDGSQVVAVLDTGGDYTHPDLEANTWSNSAEANGVEGYDDDGNGYVDDIRGWDFINVDNAPLDDNMHGTHVAGIIGAVGNNGIGIAGAAWNVKLMHIKVFQSTGQGNSLTIAEGVEYAYMNGADILNMSFGSYGESSTLKLALENAYTTSILVGAAGNNKTAIGPCLGCFPFFPGAYSFVLGVEDFTGTYDNFDQDGPIFSLYTFLHNYEVQAPGSLIMSTVPNGGYAHLTGTSMATPLVAGALALYNQLKPEDSKELMFGNLINTSTPNVDFLAAITAEPIPELAVLSSVQRDTINGQNGNGFWEPTETIEILPLVKNYWGPTDDVRVGIEFAEFEDTSKATIVQDEIQIGSISAYATLQDLYETLKITIADGVANNVDIKFVLTAWSGPDQEYMSEPTEIVINVKNSILLSGVISEDVTLTADKEYLVSGNLSLVNDATLTIMPGTTLKFSDNKKIAINDNAKLICNGEVNNMITLTAENETWGGIFSSTSQVNQISYTIIERVFNQYPDNVLDRNGSGGFDVDHSIFRDNSANGFIAYFVGISENWSINYSNFVHNQPQHKLVQYISDNDNSSHFKFNNIINNYYRIGFIADNWLVTWENVVDQIAAYTNIFNSFIAVGDGYSQNSVSISIQHSGTYDVVGYLGSTSQSNIDREINDFMDDYGAPGTAITSNVATQPFEQAHGIVWKVEVNGYDAQDEYALLDPIGVGTHEFKVYFNRAMDTSVDPRISYGVIMPYNQKIITEEGAWSTDGKIYTVNHEVNIGAADGINRIRVQDAQDLDYFVIPVEQYRFNMLVQSAGSASTGWYATPGLGKIALTWEAPSSDALEDVLGYNMYRYQVDGNGNEGDVVKLNESLIIEDTDDSTTGVYYTDFDVVEGETYFYKYKILRTSFEETDYSNAISASPLTSTLGDSNGDFSVDVLDLVHDVDYILGNNPEPFIFVAGDVNADETINVLDIVGTVDIILSDDGDSSTDSQNINFYPSLPIGYATFSWEGNDLYVESDHNIGGIQLAFDQDFEYVLSEMPGIERLDYQQEDQKILMLYSFNNTTIASNRTKLLTRINQAQEINIDLAVVGTTSGSKLTPVFDGSDLDDIDSPLQSSQLEFLSMIPNPSDGVVTLTYYLPEQMDGVLAKVYDMLGRLVWIQPLKSSEGQSQTQMQLDKLQAGNYIVLISANKQGGLKHLSHKILIIQ
jgi:subtilisin family serine protease